MIETAESENRDFTAEEQQTSDRIDGEITSLTNRISRQERDEQRARDMADPPAPRPHERDQGEGLSEQFRALARGEQRVVTVNFNAADVQRDLTVGTDTAGGHTVPTSFVRSLYESLVERSAIRQTNVRVLTTTSGEKMLVPKVTTRGSAALVSEGGTLQESDPAFGQVELDAYKYGQLIQLSSELIADSGVNILDFIARDAGRALGEATGTHYVTGDGSSKPAGVSPNATNGVTADSDTEITAEEVIDLYFSVIGPYRRNGYWMMNDSTLATVAKLQDGSGRYLLDPLATTTPQTIRGRPVVTDHNMAEIAASARVILFGDFSGYTIRDVGSMRFERSEHFAFDTDLVTFRSIMRTDGELVDTTGAVKALDMGAGT